MAITQTITDSFKEELVQGIHNFSTDVFRLALYTSSATLNASTTVYATTNETTGTGYTAGGNILSGTSINLGSGVAYISFFDTTWPSSTFTARGALLYNSSKGNRAVAVFDFGTDKTATNGDFAVIMPLNSSTTALIRLE